MTGVVAAIALALVQGGPRMRVAFLPPRMQHEDARVLYPTYVEPTAPSFLRDSMESEARKSFEVVSDGEVKAAALEAGLIRVDRYADANLLEAVRRRLQVDVLVAPVVTAFDWFNRPAERIEILDPCELRDEERWRRDHGSIFDPVPPNPRVVKTRQVGHSAQAFAYLCDASGVTKTRPMTSEIEDAHGRPRTERATARGVSRLLLREMQSVAKRPGSKAAVRP